MSSGKSSKSKQILSGTENEQMRRFLNDSAIKKMARRAGVKRIDGSVYNYVREHALLELEIILDSSVQNMELSKRKTVSTKDVITAIENERGIKLAYGDKTKEKLKRKAA